MRRLVVIAVAVVFLASAIPVSASVQPQLAKCSLRVGEEKLAPIDYSDIWVSEHRAGGIRYLVHEDKVVRPEPDGRGAWTTESEDGRLLHWRGADAGFAYLLGYGRSEKGYFTGYDSPPRLRKLDLDEGAWLPDVPLPAATSEDSKPRAVVDVLADRGKVVVLTSIAEGPGERVVRYDLRCYRPDTQDPIWVKTLTAEPGRPEPGAYLRGIRGPDYASAGIQHLSWMGDRLLVCAEARQPIFCLRADSGAEVWRLERVWEFQRGFIGPSVWSHYIGRFGVQQHELESGGKELQKLRRQFDKRFDCALIGGPVAVPLDFERHPDTHSIFVAVSKARHGDLAGYLADCVIYEFTDAAQPLSVANIPQMIEGTGCRVVSGGIVWKCQNDTFLKLKPAKTGPHYSPGGDHSGRITRVSWLRRAGYEEPSAWFIAGRARVPAAFGNDFAFCIPAGGYIIERDDTVYRFPITAVDLSTGLDQEMILEVPFAGDFTLPRTNISGSFDWSGPGTYRGHNPHEIAITALRAREGHLKIVLGTPEEAGSLKFDVQRALTE